MSNIAEEILIKATEALDNQKILEAAELFLEAAKEYEKAKEYQEAGDSYTNAGYAYYDKAKEEIKTYIENQPDSKNNAKKILDKLTYAHECFHNSRMMFQEEGFHTQARESYINEMKTYRKLTIQKHKFQKKYRNITGFYNIKWRSRIWLFILEYTCKYGESPLRFAIWVLAIILIFASLYSPCGFVELGGVEWKDNIIDDAITATHFSVITFSTLGYGNIHPINLAAKIITCIEVFIGYITFGILLVLISRKLTYP